MKKFFSFAVTAMAIFGLGSLTSCQDEDFDVSTAVLQERAFEQGFIKEFGKPSADQSFDFYAQMMQSLRGGAGTTRATQAITIGVTDAPQPTDADFQTLLAEQIDKVLKDRVDNSNTGQNTYTLTSTGVFKIYAVRYVGDIEKNTNLNFQFGIAYISEEDLDSNGKLDDEVRVPLFGAHSVDSNNNPGLGKEVDITPGTSFYFYIEYTQDATYRAYYDGPGRWDDGYYYYTHTFTRRFYSNQSPSYEYGGTFTPTSTEEGTLSNTSTRTFTEFGGCSTLLYSSASATKRYMIIGFEDAWGYGTGANISVDKDFNDFVLVIEGDFPEPSSKRFFCEDLQSFDWDYNDVVFDVTSRGVVLRAVGGTLPVYLVITDKNGVDHEYGELHELMWSKQSADEKRKHPKKMFSKNGRKYYKPIRVGAEPGLAIEAVELDPQWDYPDELGTANGLALSDEELIRFANPKSTNEQGQNNSLGGIKLYVFTDEDRLPTSTDVDETNFSFSDYAELPSVDKDGSFKVITPYVETAPAIWSAPSSVNWMKETVKITKAYPAFYGQGTTTDATTGGMPMWWNTGEVNLGNTYTFSGDVDPDRPQ